MVQKVAVIPSGSKKKILLHFQVSLLLLGLFSSTSGRWYNLNLLCGVHLLVVYWKGALLNN